MHGEYEQAMFVCPSVHLSVREIGFTMLPEKLETLLFNWCIRNDPKELENLNLTLPYKITTENYLLFFY